MSNDLFLLFSSLVSLSSATKNGKVTSLLTGSKPSRTRLADLDVGLGDAAQRRVDADAGIHVDQRHDVGRRRLEEEIERMVAHRPGMDAPPVGASLKALSIEKQCGQTGRG